MKWDLGPNGNRREFLGAVGLGLAALLGGAVLAKPAPAQQADKRKSGLNPAQARKLRTLLIELLQYFVDNQDDSGLMFDRQRNRGPRKEKVLLSSSATGMGLIALALASHPEIGLLTRTEAERRITRALERALKLPQVNGMVAHFFENDHQPLAKDDAIATIDSAWLVAGALWVAAYFNSAKLGALARELYERIDWLLWTTREDKEFPDLLHHGMTAEGKLLPTRWDRLNAESAFMYLIAMGSCAAKNISKEVWKQLKPHWHVLVGQKVASADLGLFALRWSLELFDFGPYFFGEGVNLVHEGRLGALLNYQLCRSLRDEYQTFKYFWGLSAGDGPDTKEEEGKYREYSPQCIDGTANIESTLLTLDSGVDEVFENLEAADSGKFGEIHGRYGYSSVNLHRKYISPDVIATDVAAAAFAIFNQLFDGLVRAVFARVPCVLLASESMRGYRR
jgi:hypothetical protein